MCTHDLRGFPVLTRRTPIRRKTRLRQRRARPRRRDGSTLDSDYRDRVRSMVCAVRTSLDRGLLGVWTRCGGRVHAHHAGRHPAGAKAPDSTCVPLCRAHHAEAHEVRGAFRGLSREQVRDWEDLAIAETRLALGWREVA